MSRYIDAEQLYNHMYCAMCGTGYQSRSLYVIKALPTADVVEVVRCKDCKWFNPINNSDHGYCGTPFHGAEVYEDDYCSDGERLKNESK